MNDRRGFWGAVLIAALLLARSPAGAGSATEARRRCDCDGPDMCITSIDCQTTCTSMACTVAGSQVCAVGVFAGCDANCGAICNTPVPTPSSTATVTATVTATPISTPATVGAPASSPRGLAIGVGILALNRCPRPAPPPDSDTSAPLPIRRVTAEP